MRKHMMLAICGVLIGIPPLFAETETVNGYTWAYRISGDAVEIYNNYDAAVSPAPIGAVTVPSTLGGKSVAHIGID